MEVGRTDRLDVENSWKGRASDVCTRTVSWGRKGVKVFGLHGGNQPRLGWLREGRKGVGEDQELSSGPECATAR